MNWLSKLLGFKDIVIPDVGKLLEDSRKESIELFSGTVDPQTQAKDISEPVYAIIRTMQKYPSRFKFKYNHPLSKGRDFTIFNATDVKTGEKVVYSSYYFYGKKYKLSWQWLTKDEEEILCEEGLKLYNEKIERMKSFERERMKRIYK